MTSLDDTTIPQYTAPIHAGGGTVIAMGQLCALIPGLLPFIALTVVFALPLLVPFVLLGLLGVAAYLLWGLRGGGGPGPARPPAMSRLGGAGGRAREPPPGALRHLRSRLRRSREGRSPRRRSCPVK